MTRFDLRWARRHPLRWVRLCWWQWAFAAMLWFFAVVRTREVFAVVLAFDWWPIFLGAAGGAVALSSLAPLDKRVQNAVAVGLLATSVLQVVTFAVVAVVGDVSTGGRVIAATLAGHWVLIGLIAFAWPEIAASRGSDFVVEAGRDERGAG